MLKQLEFAEDYIFVWEDGQSKDPNKTHSMDQDDPGNWSTGKTHQGQLVGSNHGVTPIALASFRKVPVSEITQEVMHKLTLEEAAQIALQAYYFAPKLHVLPWDPIVASLMDFGWGTGTKQAMKVFQRMLGITSADGCMGPVVTAAYASWIAKHTYQSAATEWANARIAFYKSLDQSKYGKYLKGWTSRTMYFTSSSSWWKRFMT